jgi:hypothetical protein
MFCARLFAGTAFAAFSLAAVATLRLAVGEPVERPRDSSLWIALGLQAEQAGDFKGAAEYLLRAEKVDRQYQPAWTAANFFFRHPNDAEFWRAAKQAATMSYDDPTPLIDLVDHREPQAIAALVRLGDTPRLERGYLDFLIGQSRWPEALEVASRLASHNDAQDGERLLSLTDRLIVAGKADAALEVARARAGTVTNGEFRTQPSGHGFDWRVSAPPGGGARWEPSRLRLWLASSTPDACALLDQFVVLAPGKYRLWVQYRTEGLAEPAGLRWVVSGDGIEQTSGPLERAANFEVKKRGVYQLRLVYVRVPGTMHVEGRVDFTSVGLQTL